MKVICVNNNDASLTLDKVYNVVSNDGSTYTVINDKGVENTYLDYRFKIISEGESVKKC